MHYENAANEACGTLTFCADQKLHSVRWPVCQWHFDKQNMPAHIINSHGTKKRPRMHIEHIYMQPAYCRLGSKLKPIFVEH